MEQASHPDAKDLKLSKITKGLRSIFKTNLCGKKRCNNKWRLEAMPWVKKKTMKSTAQNKFSSIWRGCLKVLAKEVVLPKSYRERDCWTGRKAQEPILLWKKMHAAKEGGLDDLFCCHQKTYVCTELRITVTKASDKSRKKKVANTHKVICKTKKQSQSKK